MERTEKGQINILLRHENLNSQKILKIHNPREFSGFYVNLDSLKFSTLTKNSVNQLYDSITTSSFNFKTKNIILTS